MSARFRHCVECPECGTRYLIGFSPYGNGSYLVLAASEFLGEFKLVCSCGRPPVRTRRCWTDLKTYCISSRAYARGYGSAQEIYLSSRHGGPVERGKELR
jgi:hypothetical protein